MKRKILSFVLVATMLMSYTPFAFAEDLDLESPSEVVEENIEENDALNESEEVDLGTEELDADKEQISSDSVYEIEEDTTIIEVEIEESEESTEQETTPSDSVYEVEEDTTIIEVDTGVAEGSEEPSSPDEDTTPSIDLSGPEGSTEVAEDNADIDEGFGVDSEETETTAPTEEDIDSGFGVEAEDAGIGSMEEDTEGEEITTGDAYIDPSQDDSGYIVIETPEDAYEDLDINGPTATEEDPEEEVDAAYTITEEEEEQGQTVAREPLIFKSYDGLTLYRSEDGAIAASDYVCTNSTGVDVCLIGVEVVPINGWSMVGYEADFMNMKSDTREFRLTVNYQVILDYDNDGYIPMDYPVTFLNGEEICVPMGLEIGPFRSNLNEGLFSFVLVFQEIIKEEPVKEETKTETQEVTETTQEESKEDSQEIQESTATETPADSEVSTEEKTETGTDAETSTESTDDVGVEAPADTETETLIEDNLKTEEEKTSDAESGADAETDSPTDTESSTENENVEGAEEPIEDTTVEDKVVEDTPADEETTSPEVNEPVEDIVETTEEQIVPDTEVETEINVEDTITSIELTKRPTEMIKAEIAFENVQFVQAKAELDMMKTQVELCPLELQVKEPILVEETVAQIEEVKIEDTCAATTEADIVEDIPVVEEIAEVPAVEVETETITEEVENNTVIESVEE